MIRFNRMKKPLKNARNQENTGSNYYFSFWPIYVLQMLKLK